MNTTSVLGQQTPIAFQQSGGTDWDTAVEHLNAKEYEQIIHILQKRQATAEKAEDAVLSGLLAAAQQICLGCIQHQAEIEQHRHQLTQAVSREKELQQQLGTLLDLVQNPTRAKSGLFSNEITKQQRQEVETQPASNDSATLWQRVQALLGNAPETDPPSIPEAEMPMEELSAERPSALGVAAPIDVEDADVNAAGEVPKPTAVSLDTPSLTVYCLGPFRVYANGRLVDTWSGHKSKSIFKHMLVHRDQPANHEILMELFWPGEDPDLARRSLYQAIYMIRQALQQDDNDFSYVICQDGAYGFNPRLSLWVDSAAFETHYKKGMHLERQGRLAEAVNEYEMAESLYEGDFLSEDVYEEWLLVHRERLKHAHLDLLDRLSQYHWTARQFAMCITYCLKILRGDNCREDVHRRLMLAYLHQGQRQMALRQYHRCVEALAQELDVEPMPATEKLYQQIVNSNVQIATN